LLQRVDANPENVGKGLADRFLFVYKSSRGRDRKRKCRAKKKTGALRGKGQIKIMSEMPNSKKGIKRFIEEK